MPLNWLVEKGFAVVSVDDRLSPVAPFPAQIYDCKAAIRFLRAQQNRYRYDAQRIAIAGSSAGGHLVALAGTTNGRNELEGRVGEHLDQSSSVQATIDYYGPANFMTILKQSTPHGLSVRIPALQLLLGSQPEDNPILAKLESPVFHVDANDPPLLILHGDQDPQVPINHMNCMPSIRNLAWTPRSRWCTVARMAVNSFSMRGGVNWWKRSAKNI